MLDQEQKSLLLSSKNNYPTNFENEIYRDERIKACDDSHRKFSLEHLARNYQIFMSEGESEKEVKERQNTIWGIFDKYYK